MNLGSLDQVIHLVLGFFKEWKIKQQCQVSSGEPQQQMSGTFHKETLVGPITSTCIWGEKFLLKKRNGQVHQIGHYEYQSGQWYLGEGEGDGSCAFCWPDWYWSVASSIVSAITALFSICSSEAIASSYFSCIHNHTQAANHKLNKEHWLALFFRAGKTIYCKGHCSFVKEPRYQSTKLHININKSSRNSFFKSRKRQGIVKAIINSKLSSSCYTKKKKTSCHTSKHDSQIKTYNACKHNSMDSSSNWINLENMRSIFLRSSILLSADAGILCDFLFLLHTHQDLQLT